MDKNSMDTYPRGTDNLIIEKVGGRETRRKELAAAVKDTNQPGIYQTLDEHFFGTEHKPGTLRCNFPVTLVTYEALIPEDKTDGQKVEKATYLILEPQFEWNKKWLTYSFEKPNKTNKGYRIASEPDTYANTQYFYCLSHEAAHTKLYSKMYVANKNGTYAKLTEKDVWETFHVMKCNEIIDDQTDYNDHCQVMHGITPAEMKAEDNITVIAALPLKLSDAMNILSLGTGDHDNILQDWFNKLVASGIVIKSTNKNSSDIQINRSKEMLTEMIRVTEGPFNTRLQLELQKRETVRGDLKYGFSCKWSDIEACFYAALGKDQAVDRHNSFFKDQYSLGGNTMEFIIR